MFTSSIKRFLLTRPTQAFFSSAAYNRQAIAKYKALWDTLSPTDRREHAFHPSVPLYAFVEMEQGDFHLERGEYQKAIDAYNAAKARDENYEAAAEQKISMATLAMQVQPAVRRAK